MVVLVGMGDTKVETHQVQKMRLWQGDAKRSEIRGHIKNQAVRADLQTVMVKQKAIGVAAICVQCHGFHQSSLRPTLTVYGGVQFDGHTCCRTTVHGVEYVCRKSHIKSLFIAQKLKVYTILP